MDGRQRDNRLTYSAILFLLCVILVQNGCGANAERIKKIIVPEKKGVLIDTVIKHDLIFLTDTVFVEKHKKIVVENKKEIEKLKAEITRLISENKADSIIYIVEDKTTLKRFNGVVNDNYLNINYNGIVEGNLKTIEFDYTIKQREVEVLIPKSKVNFFIGANANYSTKTDNASLGVETGLIINKNIYKVGINSDNTVSIGIGKVF